LPINIYRTPASGVFRHKGFGFAVCGENLASVSQFVAGIRHGRPMWSLLADMRPPWRLTHPELPDPFLAPGLVKAAIEGRLPHGMEVVRGVVRLADLPAEWSRQHQMLGLPAQ
jgi:hypothetical protein